MSAISHWRSTRAYISPALPRSSAIQKKAETFPPRQGIIKRGKLCSNIGLFYDGQPASGISIARIFVESIVPSSVFDQALSVSQPPTWAYWMGIASTIVSFLASLPVVLVAFDVNFQPAVQAEEVENPVPVGSVAVLATSTLGFFHFLATSEKWMFTKSSWSQFARWVSTFTAALYGISASQLLITSSIAKVIKVGASLFLYGIAAVASPIFAQEFARDVHGAFTALVYTYGLFWGVPFALRGLLSFHHCFGTMLSRAFEVRSFVKPTAQLGFTTEWRFITSSALSTLSSLMWVFYSSFEEHHHGHFVISIIATVCGALLGVWQFLHKSWK
ncbi:hypothetical protein SELMODRAFT_427682 [Selaginella moellendorffii]|uniref:Uncharacterized protein n=1 Tax=Selaginella moellendorffii TaxID=88036 RepID=D8T0D7_SELML|nr:hypothetical protein SELMODRAFT_427682 [Selaginella moellendorffii]